MQDNSFEEFSAYLNENAESIRDLLYLPENSPVREFFTPLFLDNFIRRGTEENCDLSIAATDSSEFIRELYNGKKLILVRAFTKLQDEIAPRFLSRVLSIGRDDTSKLLTMLMEHLEHLSVIDFLESGKCDAVLIDGSITGRLAHGLDELDAEGFERLPLEYFSDITRLIKIANNRGIPLLFVAKSSETTIFRRHLESSSGRRQQFTGITDHLLVKSIAPGPGYTRPVTADYRIPGSDTDVKISTFHLIQDLGDIPMKIDFVHNESNGITEIPERIVNMLFFGYAGYKVHNLWLADVDNAVKFRKSDTENVFMKEFEKQVGVQFYETRGERRVRTRI